MKRTRWTKLQLAVHITVWIPLVWMVRDYLTGNLTFNPIQAAEQRTGDFALIFLMLSLACTPAATLFGFTKARKLSRPLGLYAFMYATLHFLLFTGVDYTFNWLLLFQALMEKHYIWVGLPALLILLALAVTSFRWWMKRLGKSWKRLHRLVYMAGVLVVIHYAWVVKGDLLRLQGDIWRPLLAGAVLTLLLVSRIPSLRRRIVALRMDLRFRLSSWRQRRPDLKQDSRGNTHLSFK